PAHAYLTEAGQGSLAIGARGADERTPALLAAVTHADPAAALTAERAFLTVLEGSCRTPIAGHAVVAAGRLRFHGLIAKPDGRGVFETKRKGAAADAVRLGAEAGPELNQRARPPFFPPL